MFNVLDRVNHVNPIIQTFDIAFDRVKACRQSWSSAPLRVQFLLTFWGGGEEQEASALLSKKRGEESIESQQKFDFFCYDDTPYYGKLSSK